MPGLGRLTASLTGPGCLYPGPVLTQGAPLTTIDARDGTSGTGARSTTTGPRQHASTQTLRRIVVGLFVGHLLLRGVVFGSAYFQQDDFVLQGRAGRLPLFSGEYLLHIHSDHLMPGGFFLAGLTERLAPLNYWAVLLQLLLLQALASWLTVRLLVRVFGLRPLVLAPVAVALFSPLTLQSSTWWAAALNLLPVQAAGAAAGLAAVRLVRTGQRRWVLATVLATAAGLAFDNKAALIPLVVLGVAWVARPDESRLLPSLWHLLHRHLLLWLALTATTVGYLALYLSLADPEPRSVADSSEVVRTAWTTLIQGLVPAVAGGPIRWTGEPGSGLAWADPPVWFVVVALHVVVLLAAWGILDSKVARRAWLVLGIYVGLDLALVAFGRSGLVDTIGLNLRYTADSILLVSLALGTSLMAPPGMPEGARAARVRAWLDERPRKKLALGLGALYGYVFVAVVSAMTLLGPVSDADSRTWLGNVRGSIEEVGGAVTVLDASVPEKIYWPLGYPYNQLSWVLSPIDEVSIATTVGLLGAFDETGTLKVADVTGASSIIRPDGSFCWRTGEDGALVRLERPVFDWRYVMKVGYLAEVDTQTTVQLGDGDPVEVPIEGGGVNDVYVDISGGGDVVSFGPSPDGVDICVNAVVGEVDLTGAL